jgi:hypothetical protein
MNKNSSFYCLEKYAMRERVFTSVEVLRPGEASELDPYEEQLRQSYHALLRDIIHQEGHPRQFTREEYWNIASFLADHNGNPLGFALCMALRKTTTVPIPFLAHRQTERVVVGHFDEHTGVFQKPPWHPLDDEALRASYRDHRSSRYWAFALPENYPHTLVKITLERGQERYHVMYRPEPSVMIPGVFFPAELSSADMLSAGSMQQTSTEDNQLRLGTFLQFVLEAFPVLCPAYRVPRQASKPGTHLLELFLQALSGKAFAVSKTSFHAQSTPEKCYPLPPWAQRWYHLWQTLPPDMLIGKGEIMRLVNLLGEESMVVSTVFADERHQPESETTDA